MRTWKKCCAGLLLASGLAPEGWAQVAVPAVPVAPAAPAVAAVPAAAPAAPAPANLWSFICLTPEQKAACKDKFCNSALGQMLNNGLKPMSAFSGGIVPPCCPLVTVVDLAKPADTAEGAAARVKADELAAKARREAVRYLGTVDCHYWPEAQEALINALRGDRNECVRWEAAHALSRGCCCTKPTIKALVLTVSCGEEDGFPSERSERVRAMAQAALAHCLSCYTEVVPAPEPPPPPPGREPVPPGREPLPAPSPVTPKGEAKPDKPTPERLPANFTQAPNPAEYYHRAAFLPRQQVLEEMQRVLSHAAPVAAPSAPQIAFPQRPGSVLEIMQFALGAGSPSPEAAPAAHAVAAKPTQPPPAEAPTTAVKATAPEATPAPAKQAPAAPAKSADSAAPPLLPATQVVTTAPAVPATRPKASTPAAEPAPRDLHPLKPVPNTAGLEMTMAQVVATLKDSPHPEYRVWAAENLATVDGWTHPDVVAALANAARNDRVATVRATCVRTLGRMRVATMQVMTAVQSAKGDPDKQVRYEAEQALLLIGGVEGASLPTSSPRTALR